MTMTIRNASRQILKTYRVQVMKEPTFTPVLIQSVASEMIDSTLGKDSDKMVTLSLRMKLKDQPDVVRRNYLYAPGDIVSASLSDLNEVLQVTQTNGFARGAIQRVDVDVNVTPMRKTARIKNIFADRNKIKAGQTVRVSVEIEPTTTPGKTFTKTFSFAVPADAPTGVLRIAAGTSGDYWGLATRVGNAPPDPTTLRELLDAYAKIGAQNQLMVQASTPRTFLLVDRTKVPNPPASWSRLLRQSSSSSVAAYNDTQTQTANIEYSLSGNGFLAIPVESERRSDEVAPDAGATTAAASSDALSSGGASSAASSASSASTDSDAGDDASANTMNGLGAFSPQLFGKSNNALQNGVLPNGNAAQNDDAASHGFRAFENALNRGLKRNGFRGAFSPIEYSIPAVTRDASPNAQAMQAPADPNAPKPKNPIAPGAGEIVKPSPVVPAASATPSPTATPIATPSVSPTATPTVDNGTNLSRPSSSWIQSSALEFTRGDFKGAQVTSEGTIQISARVRQLATTTETFAWSVAGDKAGNTYVGTGNNARIYKISPSGQSQVIYNGKEVAVTALTTDDAGNLYAGVSPNSRVLRFSPNGGEPTTIFSSGDAFVWVLKFDDKGRLLVGTGGTKGKIFRLSDVAEQEAVPHWVNGRMAIIGPLPKNFSLFSKPLATVPQKHIRAIATRGDDIFIGTSDDGVLYRVDGTSGKTTALYEVTASGQLSSDFSQLATAADSSTGNAGNASIAAAASAASSAPSTTASGTEILAVAALPDGVYFGTASSGTLYRWTESGVTAVYPTPQNSIYALQVAPDGSLIAATGEKGIVYQFRTGANTSGARILEPTQTQALALAISNGDLLIGTGNNAALYRAALSGIGSGTYTSNVFDAKNIVQWGAIRVVGDGLSVQTRSGNTLDPDSSWSNWQNALSNDLNELRVASPNARYLQYRATLSSTGNATKKPQLSRIEVSYRAKNTAPQTAWTSPVGGEYWRAIKKLTWAGQDADNDRLRYALSVSSDDGATWKPLELKDATTASFDFDTTKLTDGTYRVKVQASDVLSNPDDPQTDSQISAPFTVDNTAPQISGGALLRTITPNNGAAQPVTIVELAAGNYQASAIVTDALSPISGAEYRFVGADKAAEKPTPKPTPAPTSSTGNATKTTTTAKAADAKAVNAKTAASITLVPAKSDVATAPAPPATAPVSATATSDDWRAMSASDGIFDSRRETVLAVFEEKRPRRGAPQVRQGIEDRSSRARRRRQQRHDEN